MWAEVTTEVNGLYNNEEKNVQYEKMSLQKYFVVYVCFSNIFCTII
jgi:hypothetical protein